MKVPGKQDRPEDITQQKNIRMNEIEIIGEFEKPKTMFVIPQAPYDYSWEKRPMDFAEEILTPVDKRQVDGMQQWSDRNALP